MTILFLMILLLSPLLSENQTLTNNGHVTLKLKLPDDISVSKSGEIAFFFTPIEGIHINTTPAFELRLEKNSAFEIVGKPRFLKNEKDYLDITKPIEFTVKTVKGTTPGQYTLKGKLNYFYCSDKEGWCNRFTQPLDVSIEVTK